MTGSFVIGSGNGEVTQLLISSFWRILFPETDHIKWCHTWLFALNPIVLQRWAENTSCTVPWTTRVVFYEGQNFRKVFSYIWCEEISTSSPPFPLPPFHARAFSVPGLINNMKEVTCIVCSLCRGKKYKILDNISVFLRLFARQIKIWSSRMTSEQIQVTVSLQSSCLSVSPREIF